MGENDVVDSDYKGSLPSISFDIENNRFSGSGGCNRIMGPVTVEAGRLRFSNIASTMMACDNLDLEREFLNALKNTVNYKVIENQLMLSNPDKVLLVFYDPTMELKERIVENAIVDYRLNDIWVLESINDLQTNEKNYMKGLPTIEIHIKEMSFMGNGGCNSIIGKFESKDDSIKFGQISSTRMMCPRNYESEFLKALSNSDSFKIENNRLYLMQDGKIIIVFRKVD